MNENKHTALNKRKNKHYIYHKLKNIFHAA